MAYSNASLALGLGEAKLKSHLGEAFSASIILTDVEKSTDIACFTVTENSETPAFRKVSATLGVGGSEYWLSVKTSNIINEPIINLKVTHHCAPQINREYVLLLDPAPFKNTALNSDAATAAAASKGKPSATKSTSLEQKAVTPKPAKKSKRARKTTPTDTVDQKLMEAYVGKQASASLAPENIAVIPTTQAKETTKPFLKISTGSFVDDQLPHLALRLETAIDFNRTVPTATPLNEEVLDEVTVMANRLAHLEKQLIGLQNKNAQLMHENAEAKLLLTEQKYAWLDYLLILVGIVITLLAAEWLRRVIVNKKLNQQESSWFEEEQRSLDDTQVSSTDAKHHPENMPFSDPYFDDALYQGYSATHDAAGALSFTEAVEEGHESILENAEVFIEHGRPALAIQLLQSHLTDFPSESPKIWLKLLELLVAEDDENAYEKAKTECNQYFNIKLPEFAGFAVKDISSIEDFPHIVSKLEGVWSSQFAVEFLDDLIYNQASQPREGFSRATFDELFLLKKIAEMISGNKPLAQNALHQHQTSQPVLNNQAFNQAAFSRKANEKEPNLIEQAVANHPEKAENISEKNSLDTHIAAFQPVPSYDVDLLLDFDHDQAEASEASANEPALSSSGFEKPADHNTEADEIDFSLPIITTENETLPFETEKNKSEPTQDKSGNIIEWDLPKLDH
ncbi:MAG: hypothetical protein PHD12_04245 [Methylotenera sp.]|nr:hypothetical protein [Methylotenera sp.]